MDEAMDRRRARINHALDRMESAINAARIAVAQDAPFAECGDMLVSTAVETMKYMVADDLLCRVTDVAKNGGAK